MMVRGLLVYICSCFVAFSHFGSVVHSLPSSATVNSSWHTYWKKGETWINGGGFYVAGVLLSTNVHCSFLPNSSKQSLEYPTFSFGFIGRGTSTTAPECCSLGVFMHSSDRAGTPVIVWVANGDHPVGETAAVDLTGDGLVLRDTGGRGGGYVWSTNTSSVRSMNLTCDGNLVLINEFGRVVWQSFDHPTDTWLPGNSLRLGQRLTSRASSDDFSSGFYYVTSDQQFVHAFADTVPPSEYSSFRRNQYFEDTSWRFTDSEGSSFPYLRLDPDGHLKVFRFENGTESLIQDLLTPRSGDNCTYPANCGSYGVCSNKNECSCPQDDYDTSLSYFTFVNSSNPSMGCAPVTDLSCTDYNIRIQTLIELQNVAYFEVGRSMIGVNVDGCKAACLRNCSCLAAIFYYGENMSSGNCSLPSRLLTLKSISPAAWGSNVTAFIKVQRRRENRPMGLLFIPCLPVIWVLLACCCAEVKRRRRANQDMEYPSDVVIDTVCRLSFETLKLATRDFENSVGRGGFGYVFEGTLEDGTKVAVKRLDSVGQGRKEFLAEVNSIGNLRHFNLVRLIGFCDDGLHRMLVYEYMQNGSLDKWIFTRDQTHPALTWRLRQKIITGLAKGLEYLHESCTQNVIHFDIKPENILLDKDFEVKISDFGLAKMVDRDQDQVVTVIRGTPGYIAPELITGRAISVKVDVYSFGVVVLEIVCGRKIYGPFGNDCLINLVKVKADEDRLIDLVDERTEDMQLHKDEAVKMLEIAIWCLQPHFIRPTMSMVVKVLQDYPEMETLGDLSYLTMVEDQDAGTSSSVTQTMSLLSGPR